MNFKALSKKIRFNLKNIPGWKTEKKIVVFESDDWGSNRIASKKHFDILTEAGITNQKNSYDRFDTIERGEDLERLFEVLCSVKDKNGRHAVFTPFVNVANPDFEKIEQTGFTEYHYESFHETLDRYGERESVDALYRQGMSEGVFKPEFHGREHVTVPLWMRSLQNGDEKTFKAFSQKFSSYSPDGVHPLASGFRPAFYFDRKEDLQFLSRSIEEGAKLFEDLFGYRATVFDPPNGIFHPSLEKKLLEYGIHTIVVNRMRPEPDGKGGFNKTYYKFGQINQYDQCYYIRNCQFEPYDNRSAGHCIEMMDAAFRWKKPAIICSHRVNFNGGIDPENREKGLIELKQLLSKILKKWPDAEFMSSGEFSSYLRKSLEI